ncbi:Non-reducing polyketide synthase curS2 [Cladobotryum mycophilum]|uniref:Non-reducing polyketide synthase curS2 n=1 Tax=Cladobotryum mycophilum TaxID=491253 RepID=A0ABR0S8P3_9HYPO
MFQKDIIPPQAHMPHALNPKFPPLSELNIEIPSEPKIFKKHEEPNKPRRILLNNFDAAGGNACMVLEDYTPVPTGDEEGASDPRSSHVVVTSARTRASHSANKQKLIEWLRANPAARIEDVAYTTTARRMHHPLRLAYTASSIPELIAKLEAPETTLASSPPSPNPPIVFTFTGQGSHYAGMGAELYRSNPVFRETVDLCVAICESYKFAPFLDIITDDGIDMSTQNALQTQLAVLTLEIALTSFWRSAGIEPAMVMGHSLGEYAALHAAGVLSLADTLYLVGKRALLLLERCESGSCAMLAVSGSVATVRDHLKRHQSSSCDVACINSPNATVVSGTVEDLEEFQADIVAKDAKLRAKTLPVPFAFHSFQMDAILQDYLSLAGGVTYSAPKISTRQAVNFVDGLIAVQSKLKDAVWLEIGPGPVCTSFQLDVHFPELPRATWRHILGEGHSAPAPRAREASVNEIKKSAAVDLAPVGQRESKAVVVEEKVEEETQGETSGLFKAILDTIAKATRSDPSEFTEDAQLSDLGVDSIMAIEIVSTLKAEADLDLPATFVFDYRAIGGLCREFGDSAEAKTSSEPSVSEPRTPDSTDLEPVPKPESVSSTGSSVVKVDHPGDEKNLKLQEDTSPAPTVRITLLKGRPGRGKTPFYLMADGTGSIATYIHMPAFKSNTPVYGVDSPFIRCPTRLTPEVGIEGVAKLIVSALVKAEPKGNFLIGGFSAGSMVAYEVARQLGAAGRTVDGLLILDLCCPRPKTAILSDSELNRETDTGVTVFGAAAGTDGMWTPAGTTQQHLRAYLSAMRTYHPSPMTLKERPTRAAVVWAEKGLVNRIAGDPKSLKLLADEGIPTKAYPGFMEDPKLGPFACFVPNKTAADLGPNGWDKYVGDMMTLSVDGDHLDLPMPRHVHLLHERIETALDYFKISA